MSLIRLLIFSSYIGMFIYIAKRHIKVIINYSSKEYDKISVRITESSNSSLIKSILYNESYSSFDK